MENKKSYPCNINSTCHGLNNHWQEPDKTVASSRSYQSQSYSDALLDKISKKYRLEANYDENICCGKCIKCDVCKYREEYVDIIGNFNNINNKLDLKKIFTPELKCKYFYPNNLQETLKITNTSVDDVTFSTD